MGQSTTIAALAASALLAGAALAAYLRRTRTSQRGKRYRVSALYVHPVKGCRGISLQRARTDKHGFELDRFWIVVDAETGGFVTARQVPRIVLVETAIELDLVDESDPRRLYDQGGHLVLRVPGSDGPARVRFPRPVEDGGPAPRVVDVWGKPTLGLDEGDEVADYLSAYLGRPVRLLVKDPRHTRRPPSAYTPPDGLFDAEPQTAFADGFPFLVVGEASVADLSARLADRHPGAGPLDVRRFRPNVVVGPGEDPLEPYAEDAWRTIAVGPAGHQFLGTKKCGRCTVPSVDPDTGEQGLEPTRLLGGYRRVDKGNRFEACFGMNMLCRRVGAWIEVGDEVEVVEDGEISSLPKAAENAAEGGPRPVPAVA